ncbi:no significant blast hit [Histoplasma capsulatum var. duboisii H88]|uniref:No significant blast hit n=1 Tax=Ajellomyces capsulatus (strain H88) TaxID=544711 RepID=A0A8A1LA89_AJEC8|nr:no significant blast hit [Histoplasma capsulatum var. duboisii H88]
MHTQLPRTAQAFQRRQDPCYHIFPPVPMYGGHEDHESSKTTQPPGHVAEDGELDEEVLLIAHKEVARQIPVYFHGADVLVVLVAVGTCADGGVEVQEVGGVGEDEGAC